MPETIHVVYCLDDGYAEPTCVSMASMLANTKSNVHFHIISNRLSDKNKAILSSLSEQFSHGQWSFHGVDFGTSGFVLEPTAHLSIEAYYRFFIPKILPELEKVIYIDGDTVIVGDILQLWNENLDGKIAGVVSDIKFNDFSFDTRMKILGLKYDWHYFSSGVLLLKLKGFEKLYTLETLHTITTDLYKKYKHNNVFWNADQEAFNYLFKGEKYAKFLNVKYNLESQNIDLYSNHCSSYGQNTRCLSEWSNANNSPIVIHYAGAKKPWHLNNDFTFSPHWRLYYKYKALTPFHNPLDEKRIAEYNHHEQFIKTEALIPIDFYIKLFWRDIFLNSTKYVKQVLGNRKLAYWGAGEHITHIMGIFAQDGLYPDAVVDDLAVNWDKAVFEYTVQSAEILQGKADEYLVVLCMETKQACDAVIKLLKEYGYEENGFTYAYAEAYERENKLLNNKLDFLSYAQIGKFVIYGAGQVGITLLRYLATKDLIDNVLNFAVSGVTKESEEIMGVPVHRVTTLPTNSRVLVAVHPKLHDEIINTLIEHGITDIKGISWECYLQIRRLISDFSTEQFLRQKHF